MLSPSCCNISIRMVSGMIPCIGTQEKSVNDISDNHCGNRIRRKYYTVGERA